MMCKMLRFVLFVIIIFTNGIVWSLPVKNKIKHVILITFDGVRWQDLYENRHNFPYLWLKYADRLTFYGMPGSDDTMETASVPVSLPSYQSISSGMVQPCRDNDCGKIKKKTFPELLIEKYKFAKKEVAIFATWDLMKNAIESSEGVTFSSLGNVPVNDPETSQPDEVMRELNRIQAFDYPGNQNRLDPYTFSQALHYFEVYKPRFMWISLALTDTAAHMGDMGLYGAMLRYYDEGLNKLFELLKSEHLEQETMIIVTTDHGRGNGDHWTSHGPEYPESKRTWAFVYNGELKPVSAKNGKKQYNTLSIMPVILSAWGQG